MSFLLFKSNITNHVNNVCDSLEMAFLKTNHFRLIVSLIIKEYVCHINRIPLKKIKEHNITNFLNTVKKQNFIDCIFDITFGTHGKKNSRSTVDYWLRKQKPIKKVLFPDIFGKTNK